MGASTGVVLAIGAVTVANESIFNGQTIDLRVIAATGLGAIALDLAEHAIPPHLVAGVAWIGLATVLLTRINPNQPSPVENLLTWWDKGAKS